MTILTPSQVRALVADAHDDPGVCYADECVRLAASHEALRGLVAEWAAADRCNDTLRIDAAEAALRRAVGGTP